MKRNLFFLLVAAWVVSVHAVGISKTAALRKAAGYMRQAQGTRQPDLQLAYTALADDARQAAYYVFNSVGGGFVIVAGDDRVDGILGYSAEGAFDEARLPDNLRGWMEDMRQEAMLMTDADAAALRGQKSHASVSPLLSTTWNQGSASSYSPYNMLCPTYQSRRCVTGCVATALAQVMNYHRWPVTSTAIPAYTSTRYSQSMEALPSVTFDWGNMRRSYKDETDASATAVATLMQYCGQAVKMNYGVSASSASMLSCVNALANYFGYDEGLRYAYRNAYSLGDWCELVYGELAAQRVVLLSGSSSGGGHAFVCDGYQDEGLFHINWGWGGSYDGYFRLSLLNPRAGGTGASTTRDGYTMSQAAIVGIQQPTGEETTATMALTTTSVRVVGTMLYFNGINYNATPGNFRYGVGVMNEDGTVRQVLQSRTSPALSAGGGSIGTQGFTIAGALAEGVHELMPISRIRMGSVSSDEAETDKWHTNLSMIFHTTAVVDARGNVTLIQHPMESVKVTAVEAAGNRVAGSMQEMRVTLKNLEEEYHKNIHLYASLTDNMGYTRNRTNVTVEGGAEETVSLYFTPQEAGTYNLWIVGDTLTNEVLASTTVTIDEAPTGVANLASSMEEYTLDGASCTMTARVTNNGGELFANGVMISLYGPAPIQYTTYSHHTSEAYNGRIEPGESKDLALTVDGLAPGYYLWSVYYYPNGTTTRTRLSGQYIFFVDEATGIRSVALPGAAGTSGVTDLGGRRGEMPVGGVYIRNGKKYVK